MSSNKDKFEIKIRVNSLHETLSLAQCFASLVQEYCKDGLFATLSGDLGAGKTQFVRYVLKYFGVKENVTSPSFVILNEYKSEKFPIYHFDLYRLEAKGLSSVVDELREYSRAGCLTFVEWAQFGLDEIPSSAFKINIEYLEEVDSVEGRCFTFLADECDENGRKIIEKLRTIYG